MKPSPDADRVYVIRDTGTLVVFWIGVAVMAFALGDAILRGDLPYLLFLLPPVLFVAWVLWLVLLRPGIRFDASRAIVTNIGRRHVLPWSRVREVAQRLNVVFELDDGSRVTAVGATANRGMGTLGSAGKGGRVEHPVDARGDAAALEATRVSAAPSDAPVESTWERIPLALGAVLLVLTVIDIIIALVR